MTLNRPANLYLIGLTGGIACGKSAVVAMLAELGAAVIDADQVTRQLQQPGMPVYQQIVATFGPQVATHPGGPLDRRALGDIVFRDAERLRQLEQIVHPAVRHELHSWLAQVAAQAEPPAHPVAVLDAIKLLESGWKDQCDAIWVVTCTPEQQVQRLVQTRDMDEQEARQRIAAQPPQASRLEHATVVIDNSGSLEETRQQVAAAWQAHVPRTA
jgi:dephospho-CoA kinase